jgi:hypothetical protein
MTSPELLELLGDLDALAKEHDGVLALNVRVDGYVDALRLTATGDGLMQIRLDPIHGGEGIMFMVRGADLRGLVGVAE